MSGYPDLPPDLEDIKRHQESIEHGGQIVARFRNPGIENIYADSYEELYRMLKEKGIEPGDHVTLAPVSHADVSEMPPFE